MRHVSRVTIVAILLTIVAACTQVAPSGSRQEGSPPSGRIAFIRDGNLWVWEAGQERQVTIEKDSSPHFSPSGRYIAYIRNGELWVTDVDVCFVNRNSLV